MSGVWADDVTGEMGKVEPCTMRQGYEPRCVETDIACAFISPRSNPECEMYEVEIA
jgi:hypothetical protein